MGLGKRRATRALVTARQFRQTALAYAIRHAAAGTAAVALLVSPVLAVAQQTSRAYDIPAGPLNAALSRFGQDAGILLSFTGDLTAGKQTAGIKGTYSVPQALSELLKGTGLEAVQRESGAYSLQDLPVISESSPGTIDEQALPAVVVTAPADQPGDLPKPYAGGQVARGGRVGLLGNRDVMDTPFNVTNYTAETMANQQARSVAEVLNNDPSVRSVWSQGSYADEFFIRGFQVLNTDISWNGLYGILPGQLVGPEYAERVEVIKGATALLTGISPSGAIGGGINVVPKRASDDPITSVTATYDSRAQFGTHVDVGRRYGADNQWGIRFNGSFRDGDTAASDQFQRLGVAVFGLDYRGQRLRVSVDAGYQNQRFNGDTQPVWPVSGFQIPSAPKATQNFLPSWAYSKSQDTFGAVHAEYDLTPNWTAFAAVGGRDNKNQQLQTQPLLLNSAGDLDFGPDFFANRTNTATGQVGIRGAFNTGPVKHQVSLVGDYYREEDGFSLYYPTDILSNLYHPTNNPAPSPGGYMFDTPTNAIKKNSSLAFADTASILNDRVQLTFGVRQQRVDADNFDTTSGDVTSHYNRSATSPAVALLVKPLQNVSVYANYIQGLQQGPTAPIGAVNAGQVFSPFVSKQYEVGTKVDFGRIAATLSAFQIEQPNGVTDPNTMIFGIDGQQRNRGIELNVFGEASKSVRVLGGVTFMNGVLSGTGDPTTEGNTAVGVPHTLVNLGAEWDTPFINHLTLSGLIIYTSPQYVDVANTQKLPGWTRFDVGARYMFHRQGGEPVIIRANVENVFNRGYWAAAAPNYGIALGSARTFLLSAQFDF